MAFFQAKHLWVNQLGEGVAALVLDRDTNPHNFLDLAMLDDLDRALDAVSEADQFRLLVIRSGKTANFCHGPSPALVASWSKDDFTAWCERGQKVCSKLAGMAIPSACVIAGGCFDAGLELALACDHRVVVEQEATSLGFPELEWGMIPCWGGTQRLPHLIGLDQSLHLLLAGERLDAREAWSANLADDITEVLGETPPAFLANPSKRDWSSFPWNNWRQRWLESNRLGRWFLCRGAERILHTRIPDKMPAPPLMLEALKQAYQLPTIDAGVDFERRALEHIVAQPALHHLLRLLLHREELRLPSIGSQEKNRVRQLGIIGNGLAGLALYLHCATKGYDVVLRTMDKDGLAMAMLQVSQLLEVEVKRGALAEKQYAKIVGNFRGTYTWTHFDKLHLVVDTTDGPMAQKQAFFQEMEEHLPIGATIVPTSSIHRVEDLQQGLQHPERVVGLHLIEPWNRGSLAEIVAAPTVALPHVQRVREWVIGLGKCCLQVPDRVGGLTMRVWLPMLNEAGLMVKEGVPIDRIDNAMRRFGMSYGPCEWMDRLGIDQIAALASALQPTFAGRIAFESGFALMVEKGWLGNMSGAGFYLAGGRKGSTHRAAVQIWQSQSQGEAVRPVPVLADADAHAWIQGRLVTLTILEAVRCLEEGLVKDADDLDCAVCLTGWASHRGGPIGYGRQLGVEALTARCVELSQDHGLRYTPIAALTEFLTR